MKKVFWFSACVPFDGVAHASGKIENFYMKELIKDKDIDLKVFSFYKPEEKEKLDFDKYGIENYLYLRPRGGFINEFKRGIAWASKSSIFNKYAGFVPMDLRIGMKQLLKEAVDLNTDPDVIVLEWTEIVFFIHEIKKIWPNAKIVSIEEDVSYLGIQRRKEFSKLHLLKFFYGIKEKRVKEKEIDCLNKSDLVVFNNKKDFKLAQNDGYQGNYFIWSVFYQIFKNSGKNNPDSKDLVYYGSMSREENWRSAVWFIENVLPKIDDPEVKLVIVGGNPNKHLFKYLSDRVIIKGYVDDIGSELCNSLCLVAPLVLGAGIKVKIIESLSLGIPILTNKIGIEGIPAQDGISYFHCEEPNQYIEIINRLLNKEIDLEKIQAEAVKVIEENFNYFEDSKKFNNLIKEL